MKVLKFPVVRITTWFIMGIITAYYSKFSSSIGFGLLGVSGIAFGVAYMQNHKEYQPKPFFSICLYSLFFCIGITTTIIHNDTNKKDHYMHHLVAFEKNRSIRVLIREKLKNTTKNARYIAEIKQVDQAQQSGKILLNVKRDTALKEFIPGTGLLIRGQLVLNFKPGNPDQFDYGRYLETKGIYAQLFTKSPDLTVNPELTKDIWYYTSQFRNTIIGNLARNGFKKEELAVVTALILGQQQDISPEVLRDYQYAGAVHILSVSGLHVGFILLLVTFLLKPLPKNKWGNILRFTVVLISLWLFALIAGLAPSVVRSATMFSFLAMGMLLNRETNIYHTLIVSLFLILLAEPLFLFDVGFQLSYIALFFILWLQPKLKALWQPENKIAVYFWDILTVSFAAQIGAFPLSIYYFHQFPGLFFVTNVVLIPCLSVVMALGVLLMALAYFDIVPLLLARTVEFCIAVMNGFIKWVASIESFVIKDIPLPFSLLLLAYLALISWILWFSKPSFGKITFATCCVLLFQAVFIGTHWTEEKKEEYIVFNIPKKTIVAQRSGKKIVLFTNDSLPESSFERKMAQSYATAHSCTIEAVKKLKNTYFSHNTKTLVIDKSGIYNTSRQADVILLRESPKINLERLLMVQKPQIIIADASNYKSYVTAWKKTCRHKKIPFHSTYEKGFYSY